jgi:phage-related minor tail protein
MRPEALTPTEMAKLRVEFQQRHGMTPTQAREAAGIMARMVGEMDRLAEDLAAIRETTGQIAAHLAEIVEGARKP